MNNATQMTREVHCPVWVKSGSHDHVCFMSDYRFTRDIKDAK
jgi:hypothetical protein